MANSQAPIRFSGKPEYWLIYKQHVLAYIMSVYCTPHCYTEKIQHAYGHLLEDKLCSGPAIQMLKLRWQLYKQATHLTMLDSAAQAVSKDRCCKLCGAVQ
jgi:hypothetical protein